ncbi:hypothetical protein [Falsiroseomonas selenitidurans]|uniref:Uncharacterized protein n=1 Tax=Falsiroseomonas selenitidurans TaxID=2716335 RepID=A0ABX1DZ73_9PROT|nr:hypothetical protein [Falsiroseomonas selenitidurans]NKC30189.1 hypothetical protein [Falsiroseomonas selenitidurans]
MARIRSVHPGQWTDEEFVSCSMPARLLALALRNVADDQGVFEWKMLTLKMQLFPADTVDIAALLDELAASGQVRRFAVGERQFGAIRNFRRWQRPEKPKPVHPLPDEMLAYVGLSASDRVPIDDRPPPRPRRGGDASANHHPPIAGEAPTGLRGGVEAASSHRRASAAASPTDRHDIDGPSPIGRRPVADWSAKVFAEEGGRRETSSLRSDGVAASPPAPVVPLPVDARGELWGSGPARLARMTGKPDAACRAILGRLLREALDDCELVSRKLAEAEALRVIDPVAWIEAAILTHTGRRAAALRPGQGSGFGQVVRQMRQASQATAGPGSVFDGTAEEMPAA